MHKTGLPITLFFIISISSCLFSQEKIDADTSKLVEVTAGPHYEISGFGEFFAGRHWRELWIEPFKVPVLDLNNFEGGIKPFKPGGGKQTMSLHFKNEKGKRFKFRSIDKEPERGLPPELRNTIIADLMQDQISVINPVSSIIVAPMMTDLKIINAPPFLTVLPDDTTLRGFRDDYKNLLGTMEEHPDTYDDESLNFANADKIKDTEEVFESREFNWQEKIDARDFLKARLFDILIGDRDRHAGQWKWAGYKLESGITTWKPIPRDRDFAFPLYDGVIASLMSMVFRSMVHYDENMPVMLDMTWEGRHLDRRILSELTFDEWDSVAVFIQKKLTDDKIRKAVQTMPPELFSIEGERLINTLISRRHQLRDAAKEFYLLNSLYLHIYATHLDDSVYVSRSDSITLVEVFDRRYGQKYFSREVINSKTEEIRLYLLNGNDIALLEGSSEEGIDVFVDASGGKDELIDNSETGMKLLQHLPLFPQKAATRFYDSDEDTYFKEGNNTYINTEEFEIPDDPLERFEPDYENRGSDMSYLFPLGYNSDDGAKLGLGAEFKFYEYRLKPYSHSLGLTGAYTTKSNAYEIKAFGDFNNIFTGSNVDIALEVSELNITRFYGFGNNTLRNEELNENNFYQVDQTFLSLSALANFPVIKNLSVSFGAEIENSIIDTEENTFLFENNFYGTGNFSYSSLIFQAKYDSRDKQVFPHSGVYVNFTNNYYLNVFNNPDRFGKAVIDARTYFTGKLITDISLALRSVAEIAWGDYPFFYSASLGGKRSLRGIPRDRYRGDYSLLAQAELRFELIDFNFVIPGKLGMNLFTDAGRVFLKDEESDTWHKAFGAGLWFSVLDRMLLASFNFAHSDETDRYYFSLSQMF